MMIKRNSKPTIKCVMCYYIFIRLRLMLNKWRSLWRNPCSCRCPKAQTCLFDEEKWCSQYTPQLSRSETGMSCTVLEQLVNVACLTLLMATATFSSSRHALALAMLGKRAWKLNHKKKLSNAIKQSENNIWQLKDRYLQCKDSIFICAWCDEQ